MPTSVDPLLSSMANPEAMFPGDPAVTSDGCLSAPQQECAWSTNTETASEAKKLVIGKATLDYP